jgi:hypothetical protein
VVAFARVIGKDAAVFLTGRFFRGLGDRVTGEAWQGTRVLLPGDLPRVEYRDLLTGHAHACHGDALELEAVFTSLPCAILEPLG